MPLSVSTLADQVGAAAFALTPLYKRIEAHVLAAERLHGDDTTVPVMAKGKTDVARPWVYVRDDAPFAGADPPAALFYYSRDRRGEHPQAHLANWSGIFQADAYGGYGELYRDGRNAGPVLEAGCFAHARRKFFELADVECAARKKSRGERAGMIYPIALEAVKRLDALFDIERGINGRFAADRLAVRQELSASLMTELHAWLTDQRAKLSRNHDLAKACLYMLRRWEAFTRFPAAIILRHPPRHKKWPPQRTAMEVERLPGKAASSYRTPPTEPINLCIAAWKLAPDNPAALAEIYRGLRGRRTLQRRGVELQQAPAERVRIKAGSELVKGNVADPRA